MIILEREKNRIRGLYETLTPDPCAEWRYTTGKKTPGKIDRDEIIKILNEIHVLQQEDAPAIAQRRLEELFEKVGIGTNVMGGVDFSDDLRRLEDL